MFQLKAFKAVTVEMWVKDNTMPMQRTVYFGSNSFKDDQEVEAKSCITSGFAPAHRSDQVACEAAGLGDAARFAPHFCDCLQDSSRPIAMQAEAASEG